MLLSFHGYVDEAISEGIESPRICQHELAPQLIWQQSKIGEEARKREEGGDMCRCRKSDCALNWTTIGKQLSEMPPLFGISLFLSFSLVSIMPLYSQLFILLLSSLTANSYKKERQKCSISLLKSNNRVSFQCHRLVTYIGQPLRPVRVQPPCMLIKNPFLRD